MTPVRPHLLPALLAALAASAICAQQPAQPPAGETLVFHFERAALPVPAYTFTLHQDGTGTYAASYAAAVPASKFAPVYPQAQTAPPVETTRPIALSPRITAQLFDRVRSTDRFRSGCESKLKNIADTGAKTITYTTPEGSAHCTYNFTENKTVAAITETFQGIATTASASITSSQCWLTKCATDALSKSQPSPRSCRRCATTRRSWIASASAPPASSKPAPTPAEPGVVSKKIPALELPQDNFAKNTSKIACQYPSLPNPQITKGI